MTDSERQEYVRHLDEDQCSVCRSEVDELQSAASLLAFTVPASTPSPSVRARLMEQAQRTTPVLVPPPRPVAFRWLQWMSAGVAVASMAVAFLVIQTNSELRQTANELKSQIARLEVELAGRIKEVAVLTTPGVRVVDLAGQNANVQAGGRIFVDRQEKRWVFYVRDLPSVATDKSYQLWFVPKNGNPISASVFNTASNGSIRLEVPVPDGVPELKAAAVTIEPAGGVPQPTGEFALLGGF
jgi:anti-sigma-K factor RskA